MRIVLIRPLGENAEGSKAVQGGVCEVGGGIGGMLWIGDAAIEVCVKGISQITSLSPSSLSPAPVPGALIAQSLSSILPARGIGG